jgi:hypothetical protein
MDSTSAAGNVAVAPSSNSDASERDCILQVPLERISSVSAPPTQMVDSASQQSRQQMSSLLSANANPKDTIFCEDEEEKVCRVCCCVEPDQVAPLILRFEVFSASAAPWRCYSTVFFRLELVMKFRLSLRVCATFHLTRSGRCFSSPSLFGIVQRFTGDVSPFIFPASSSFLLF